MANLKRNMIELIKNPEEVIKGGEPEFDKYWTSPFIPLDVTLEAVDFAEKLENGEITGSESILEMADFVAQKIFNGQFTKDDIRQRLHAPDAIDELQSQIFFVARGEQSDATKKFLEKKR
ncbi:hypothetical protein DCC39_14575 [Pueribacillus theae]|uniref:Phage protein n=2 Tax=Bacillaceae TaxID=186817 RepID=A0A443IMX5_9BACI|nr:MULTISPECIES: hypothetical protein [Bacillaceae]PWA08660.1 hypothetical protein DCC39_14575 [Pueribacillus theae]RWR06751.1 hypothetical protein D4N35_013885 [Siminovitchia fortis]WHY83019.1 hypothetical protein QNH23_06485 [Siminovitchia fortis]